MTGKTGKTGKLGKSGNTGRPDGQTQADKIFEFKTFDTNCPTKFGRLFDVCVRVHDKKHTVMLLHSGTQTKFRKASSLNFTLTSDCWGRVGGVGGEGVSVLD